MLLDLLHRLTKLDIVLASASPRRFALLQTAGLSNLRVVPSSFAEDLDKSAFPLPDDYVAATAKEKARSVLAALLLARETDSAAAAAAPSPLHAAMTAGPHLIIACDTVVLSATEGGGAVEEIQEKPKDKDHALRMLQSLSGRQCRVISAVSFLLAAQLFQGGAEPLSESSLTEKLAMLTPPPSCSTSLSKLKLSLECCPSPGPSSASSPSSCLYISASFVESSTLQFLPLPPSVMEAYVSTAEPYDKAGGFGIQGMAGSFIQGVQGCYNNIVGFPLSSFCSLLRHLMVQQEVQLNAGKAGAGAVAAALTSITCGASASAAPAAEAEGEQAGAVEEGAAAAAAAGRGSA